jgi:hypothetical protein
MTKEDREVIQVAVIGMLVREGWMRPQEASRLQGEIARLTRECERLADDNRHLRDEKALIWAKVNAVGDAAQNLSQVTV